MEFLDLAKRRYSVRKFKEDKVSDEIINKIVEAGIVAPTACNNQPFKITIIKTKEGLDKLKKCTDCHFNAPLAFIISADKDLCWKRSHDGKISSDVDASIVTTHMMLEATSLGIGSTWVMWFNPKAVISEYSFPSNLEPIAILPMGYASDDAKPASEHNSFRKYEELVEEK